MTCKNCDIKENGQVVRVDVDGNCNECGMPFTVHTPLIKTPPKYIVLTKDLTAVNILQEKLGEEFLVLTNTEIKEQIKFIKVPREEYPEYTTTTFPAETNYC